MATFDVDTLVDIGSDREILSENTSRNQGEGDNEKPDEEINEVLITEDFDIDEEIDFDVETLTIIDDSVTLSSELMIHHDVAVQLQNVGFEDVHLQFIPDVVPAAIESISNVPTPKATANKMCPSCGRSYSKATNLEKHLKICRKTKGRIIIPEILILHFTC